MTRSDPEPEPQSDRETAADAGAPDHRPHRPADDSEQVYYEGSPLLRAHVGRTALWSLLGLVLIATPIVYRLIELTWPLWWVTLALVIIGLVLMTVPLLLVKALRYRISNYRIDYEHGLLSKSIETLELWHVEDIRFHQSLSERILGVGTITIISHDDTTPLLALRGLPNPRPLFEQLKQRVIAVKRQRGVIKMDVGT